MRTRYPHVLVDARFGTRKSGGHRCAFEISTHLHMHGTARYTFLTYPHGVSVLGRSEGGAATIVTPYTPEMHPQMDYYEHVHLPMLARALRADVYHGTFQVLPLIRPAPGTIVTVHDMAVFAYPQAYGSRFVRYMRYLLRAGLRTATRLIAVSDTTRREIARYFPWAEPKVVTILNGVGAEFLAAPSLPPTSVRGVLARLGLPTPYVLFVGNLEPKKNLSRLLEAFVRLMCQSDLPHRLVVAGAAPAAGPDGAVAAAYLQDARIHFTGFVDDADLPALYRGADLVAFPSIYEGFGMPVLEAMAAGIPVLTSSASSLPEVAAGAALLVDPLDIDAIAAGLRHALTDTAWRRFAVAAGRKRAEELSWDLNARRTERLYIELWERRLRSAR